MVSFSFYKLLLNLFVTQFAQDKTNEAHKWHYNYSLKGTDVLGKLACLVCSKIVGIGAAERKWKEVKRVKTAQRNRLGAEKTAKLTLLVGTNCSRKADARRERMARAGRLWNDDDFETMKLEQFGIDVDVLSGAKKPKRIFRAWMEDWESPDAEKGKFCKIHETRLVQKYMGLKWLDADNNNVLTTAHTERVCHYTKGPYKGYWIVGTREGFDMSADVDENDDETYDVFARGTDFYSSIVDYYKENKDPDIVVYELNEEEDVAC